MTTADPLVYYPQYCFHLSPTINTWCPLRASDVAGLASRPGFEDIDVFFFLNHPIRWVRIIGVVVAIDHYYGHRVYTIDDSTGQCIECAISTPNANNEKINHGDSRQVKTTRPPIVPANTTTVAHTSETRTTSTVPTAPSPIDIDIGMVLDVKGSVQVFRDQMQIKIQKVTRVLSTNQEVNFWDKTRDFRRDMLSQPWILKDTEVRRCRRLQQIEAADLEEKGTKKKARGQAERPGEGRGSRAVGIHASEGCPRPQYSTSGTSAEVMRAQRAARTEILRSRVGAGDKYDALGL
ncbi:hypothetical protein E0Z10_g6873 [Xylaria hypoxylon]|uniref:CST complex subunit STN1 n=1 Tax=Xylaria hypoxylon TaxID=37992 RepID=A0A4Z0YRY3_9PEZI|nr:hypothetical protein E0Z10_g6873 [Xylaria hypoxylon]